MEEVKSTNKAIGRCGVKRGVGQSTVTMTPKAAIAAIRKGAEAALKGDPDQSLIPLPKSFVLEITYPNPVTAYRMSWYPGAGHKGNRTIRYETANYLDILRMLNFVT
jgi:D-amino peptidase